GDRRRGRGQRRLLSGGDGQDDRGGRGGGQGDQDSGLQRGFHRPSTLVFGQWGKESRAAAIRGPAAIRVGRRGQRGPLAPRGSAGAGCSSTRGSNGWNGCGSAATS